MDNREWERFGEEIRRNVQDAVDSRDFSRLNQTITDAINGAADGISRGMRDAAGEFTRGVRDSVNRNGNKQKKQKNQYQGGTGQSQGGWQQGSNWNGQGNGQPGGMYGQSGGAYGQWNGSAGYEQPGQGAARGTYGQQGQAYGTYGQPGQGAGRGTYSQQGQGTYGGQDTACGNGAYGQQGPNDGNGSAGQYGPRYNWNRAYYSRFGNRDKRVEEENGYPGQKGTEEKQLPALYAGTVPAKIGGTMLFGVGCAAGSISLIGLAVILLAGITSGDMGAGWLMASGGAAFFAAGFGCMAGAGSGILGRVKRFRGYIRSLGSREYCNVKELSDHLGKSPRFVVKDLEKMIQKGWFRQGHFDKQKTCLMVSNDAYKQYTDLLLQTEQMKAETKEKQADAARKRAEEVQKQAEEPDSNLSPEVRKVIRTGEKYIRKIHACNDALPGREISAKISRMELLVDRIFDRVEQNPELVADLNKMMDYYLPTTVKLLEAYEDLDAEPVQGENIISSKKEIEKTLDTLNVAFEKLLDSLFQDTAWDVSSDISVLEMMLAQEGLTRDDFKEVH